ncbi:transcriptional regulator [Wolbachia endosymbiont of Litomosoides brasiliensis]|uniref:heme exporter protein CcmB n=1 Tax=Wolbachia endosymbiont of Litomosoides brasiliensis TaxID=1812117 RepID=UPI001588DB45|nr:heme exporter protein CcmB [Wolbachia endosymbiont of Litomosoides brasiliensis]NUY39623.1 transcriptional regulator [Wolbachia endosymbiont of Litomosoides brasiliensis]
MIGSIGRLAVNSKNFVYTICIFIIMLSLSSFALESNSKQEVMLTLIWICVTLILQASTSNLFISDYHDGILEQIFIQPFSSRLIIAYKIFIHWLLFGLPISVISSIFSLIVLGDSIERSIAVGLSLLLNALIIVSISATGNALMVGRNDLTLGISQILVLPTIMPTFIYFKLLVHFESLFLSIHMLFITALIFAILMVNSTIATHMALKFAVEQD